MAQVKYRESPSGVLKLRMPSGVVVTKVSDRSYQKAMKAAGKRLEQVKEAKPKKR